MQQLGNVEHIYRLHIQGGTVFQEGDGGDTISTFSVR